jgi:hypothetical protein
MTNESIGMFFLGTVLGMIAVFMNIKYREWQESREICDKCGNYK